MYNCTDKGHCAIPIRLHATVKLIPHFAHGNNFEGIQDGEQKGKKNTQLVVVIF